LLGGTGCDSTKAIRGGLGLTGFVAFFVEVGCKNLNVTGFLIEHGTGFIGVADGAVVGGHDGGFNDFDEFLERNLFFALQYP